MQRQSSQGLLDSSMYHVNITGASSILSPFPAHDNSFHVLELLFLYPVSNSPNVSVSFLYNTESVKSSGRN